MAQARRTASLLGSFHLIIAQMLPNLSFPPEKATHPAPKKSSCAAHAADVVPLSNRWSWTVILVEVASSHELPVPQPPMIADIGRLARMLLSHVRNGRDAFIPESAQVSGTSNDLADFCRAEMGAQKIAGSRS
jgi:hypothetical protein